MENFFYNDEFYPDLGELMIALDIEDEDVEKMEDTWAIEAWGSSLERLVVLSPDWIVDRIDSERFTEEGDEADKIAKILEQVDWKKINEQIPELYYEGPKSSKFIITKNDLLEFVKPVKKN